MDAGQSGRHGDADGEKPVKKRRQNLVPFLLFSILEETIIGAAAVLVIMLLTPQFAFPGVIGVAIGLAAFTVVKIHYFSSSAAIPVEDAVVSQTARVLHDFRSSGANVWTGRVRVRGESWLAISTEAVTKGESVRVTGIEGLRLKVVRIPFSGETSVASRVVRAQKTGTVTGPR